MADIAQSVRHKDLLGFFDVSNRQRPDDRLIKFLHINTLVASEDATGPRGFAGKTQKYSLPL